jgi:hypothetical protein
MEDTPENRALNEAVEKAMKDADENPEKYELGGLLRDGKDKPAKRATWSMGDEDEEVAEEVVEEVAEEVVVEVVGDAAEEVVDEETATEEKEDCGCPYMAFTLLKNWEYTKESFEQSQQDHNNLVTIFFDESAFSLEVLNFFELH